MTKGLTRKLLSLVRSAIAKKAYFSHVETQMPTEWPIPSSAPLPAAFIFMMPSDMSYLTTSEKRARLQFGVLGYVESQNDLELVKCDCADQIEEALEDLQSDSTFIQIAVQINVTRKDPGPRALVELGLVPGVFPPFGAIRVDGVIEYDYDAKS